MDARPDKTGGLPVLILGGTSEANALLRALAPVAAIAPTLSLAGRTRLPAPAEVPTRIGGFGGAEGLAEWIVANGIARVVDATHPFAARISRNAAVACARAAVPLLAIRRPPWERRTGDDWTEVEDMPAAAAATGETPRRIFLTIGRQELHAFAGAPQHAYVARTIEPIGEALTLPHLTEINARGPFTREAEAAFLREHRIERVVTKNSGGPATYGKIEAARALRIPVIVVRQPDRPDGPTVPEAGGALAWLLAAFDQPGTLRGV